MARASRIITFPALGLYLFLSACGAWADTAVLIPSEKNLRVAHAGGGINGIAGTNSLEALDENHRRGFRFFELDFEWTADGHLVAIHEWEGAHRKNFIAPPPQVPTLKEFMEQGMNNDWTQLTLDRLNRWLDHHPDAFIITDIKSRNIAGLGKIRASDERNVKRFIPQIYSPDEFEPARALGFEKIILTLYRTRMRDDKVLQFCRKHKPFAVTLWAERALRSELPRNLSNTGTRVFAHTVNDTDLWEELKKRGVSGIYTDFL